MKAGKNKFSEAVKKTRQTKKLSGRNRELKKKKADKEVNF
jgi:hypothetical protein